MITNQRRPFAAARLAAGLGAASLGAALLAALLAAPSTARAQELWPGLTGSSSWSFAGNRLNFPSGATATTAINRASLSHLYQVSPPYAVSNIRLAYVNFYVATDASYGPERCPGNGLNVDFATVFTGGTPGDQVTDKTAHTVTFGGAGAARIGDCEFVWSDPLRDAAGNLVSLPAGSTYYVRSSLSVNAVGEKMVRGNTYSAEPRWTNWSTGEGVDNQGSVQTARRLTGTVPPFANGAARSGPAVAIGTGWDGSPVFLVLGDSLGSGVDDYDFSLSTRAVVGAVARGLDDGAGSARMNYAMWTVPGSSPWDQSSIAAGEFRLRMRLLRSIPNKPFNRIFSQANQNGLYARRPGYAGVATFAQWRGAMEGWWRFLDVSFGSMPIYQSTAYPHAIMKPGTLSYFTNIEDQYPASQAADLVDGIGGTRDQANAWLRAGAGLPLNVTVIDLASTAEEPSDRHKWKPIPGEWTLVNAVSANTVGAVTGFQVSGASPPTVGDVLGFDYGTPNADGVQVLRYTGTGPWTVFATGNLARAHAAGVIGKAQMTNDGTHPLSTVNKNGAALIIQKKANGTIH